MHAYRRLALSRRFLSSSYRLCSESTSSVLQTPAPPPPTASPAVSPEHEASTSTQDDAPRIHTPFEIPPRFASVDKQSNIKDFLNLVDELREPPTFRPKGKSRYPILAPGQTPHASGKNRKARKEEALEAKKEKRKRREAWKKAQMIKEMEAQGLEYVPPKHKSRPPLEVELGVDTSNMSGKERRRLRRKLRKERNQPVDEEKMANIKKLEQQRAAGRIETELERRKEQAERSKAEAERKKLEAAALAKKGVWMGEEWAAGWGKDKLAPPPSHFPLASIDVKHPPMPDVKHPSMPVSSIRHRPPHLVERLAHDKKIEGLLSPSTIAVPGAPQNSLATEAKPILEDLEPKSPHNPIATLSHGLDRVLFNPGVHWLQDPRSRVYNFTPYLESIPKVTDFAFERIVGFIRSSRDEDLLGLAKQNNKPFAGSTSSLSGMLSHIYFLLSGDKPVNTGMLSKTFAWEPKTFTPGQRMPATVVFNHNNGHYAIDSAEKGDSDKNVLTWMGTLLERFMTMSKEEFDTFLRKNPPPEALENPLKEAYRYSKSEKFVMRSQLDCHDSRLPGTGVFDIKTRACLPIRMDLLNYEENAGYQLRTAQGRYESFEREYYDLIRSAFLKYQFQVRIGNMDGVIVAYHNTEKMFGFQYVPLEEMDEAVFGGFKLRVGARARETVKAKQEQWEMPSFAYAEDGLATSGAAVEKVGEVNAPAEEIVASTEEVDAEEVVPLEGDTEWKKKQGDRIFEVCIRILEKVAQEVVDCFPGQSVKATFEKHEPWDAPKGQSDHVMNVWVEPVDWTPVGSLTEEDRPVKQLEVRVTNYFGQEEVTGAKAVSEGAGEDWLIHWSVGRLTGLNTDVRHSLKQTLDRQFRMLCIPSGIEEKDVQEWWKGLNYGYPSKDNAEPSPAEVEAEAAAQASVEEGLAEGLTDEDTNGETENKGYERVFVPATRRVQFLRNLARKGREASERIRKAEEAAGKKKVVYGEEV